jgi:hypothetical protein
MNPAAQFDPGPFACLHVSTGFQPVADIQRAIRDMECNFTGFLYNDLPLRICIPDAQMGYRPHGAMAAGWLSVGR